VRVVYIHHAVQEVALSHRSPCRNKHVPAVEKAERGMSNKSTIVSVTMVSLIHLDSTEWRNVHTSELCIVVLVLMDARRPTRYPPPADATMGSAAVSQSIKEGGSINFHPDGETAASTQQRRKPIAPHVMSPPISSTSLHHPLLAPPIDESPPQIPPAPAHSTPSAHLPSSPRKAASRPRNPQSPYTHLDRRTLPSCPKSPPECSNPRIRVCARRFPRWRR
jgi:hypothetical protein